MEEGGGFDGRLDSETQGLKSSGTDFVGLAACELSKRLLPDRPSVEMIDDWMQEGYEHDTAGRPAEASRIWWKVWQWLQSRFSPGMRTMDAAEAVFSGTQAIFNWCQNFELSLSNAAIDDPEFAALASDTAPSGSRSFPTRTGARR